MACRSLLLTVGCRLLDAPLFGITRSVFKAGRRLAQLTPMLTHRRKPDATVDMLRFPPKPLSFLGHRNHPFDQHNRRA